MPERDPMIEFWERMSWDDAHSKTTRKFARRQRNRLIYQSMTFKEAMRMVMDEERQHWDPDYELEPTFWNIWRDLNNVVTLNYGVVGAVSLDHQGDILSDAYQIVLRRYHEMRGWKIHPDFLD